MREREEDGEVTERGMEWMSPDSYCVVFFFFFTRHFGTYRGEITKRM